MALPTPKNRIGMSITSVASSGTGTITLNTAESGYEAFAAGDDGKTFDCLFVEGANWEVARNCTYTHSGTTLTRGTIEDSSNSDSAITLSSAGKVYVTQPASRITRTNIATESLIPGGRLTLESGVPVSTSDQTGKTNVYYTPYVHNVITLWDGACWVPIEFTEYTLALGTLTSGKPYDVFAYLNSGALALELLVWTDDTTRATAVTLQDGRYCKSGAKDRLLLGTIYTTATTTTEDSEAKRLVWNMYNRAPRKTLIYNTSTHTYTTASFREWNAGTGGTRFYFLFGEPQAVPVVTIGFDFSFSASSAGVCGYGAVGINAVAPQTTYLMGNAMVNFRTAGACTGKGQLGYNYVVLGEYGAANVTYETARATATVQC